MRTRLVVIFTELRDEVMHGRVLFPTYRKFREKHSAYSRGSTISSRFWMSISMQIMLKQGES